MKSSRKGNGETISDERIVELYWERDEKAIRETDRKYGRLLYQIAYHILHDRLDCEECQNDTYLGVWNAIPPTRPTAFAAFIVQIMRNTAVNRYKEKTKQKRVPSELTVSLEEVSGTVSGQFPVETEYEAEELGKLVNEFVRSLSERQRYIFIDRFYLAESVGVIAKALSLSVPTVYRELDRIRQSLKHYLERNGVFL